MINVDSLLNVVENCDVSQVEIIVKKHGVNPNKIGEYGNSALHEVDQNGNSAIFYAIGGHPLNGLKIAISLLQKNLSLLIENKFNENVIHVAVKANNSKFLEILFKFIMAPNSKLNLDLLKLIFQSNINDEMSIDLAKSIKIAQMLAEAYQMLLSTISQQTKGKIEKDLKESPIPATSSENSTKTSRSETQKDSSSDKENLSPKAKFNFKL